MGAWESIKKAFTTSPQQRYAEVQAKQIAEGKAFQCPLCNTIYYNRLKGCPHCQVPKEGWPPEQKQLIRTYHGRTMDKDFQADVEALAKSGWRVQSQNYGGVSMAGQGTLGELAWSTSRTRLAAARKPERLTVVYERD